jgi:3-hydroxyacyl-[acyl-carrier-protein] dehydratase
MKNSSKPLYSSLAEACLEWTGEKLDSGEMVIKGLFVFDDSFSGFAGHFPGRPILPAVIQLGIVRFLGECGLGMYLEPKAYSRIKFRGMITPGQQIKVEVILGKDEESGWHGKFSLESEDGVIANGQCDFAKAAEMKDDQG